MLAYSLRCLVLYLSLPACTLALADEQPTEKPDPTRLTELPVLLSDEDGNPVAGANVMPYAMRMKEEGGHGFWNREVHGPPKWHTSGEDGVAVIEYPGHVQFGAGDVFTTRLVTFQITHTDFVREVVHFDLGPERAEVQLKPGCEVRLSATDREGNPIEDFGVVVAGPYEPQAWARDGSGGRRTRSINDGTWQTMLVKLQDDGPTLFSDLLPLRVRPKQTVRFSNIRLSPGARLRGRLSRNVPRPVKGSVLATSVPQPAENSYGEKDPSLTWQDWVDVAEDGTFEFDSLPRSGQVQLIGVCEGWVSTTTVPDTPPVFVMGQLFDIDDDIVDIELEMEQTGTLKVEVVTPDDKPLTEGRISSWPNQKHYKGGSTFLGQKYRTAQRISNQLLPVDKRKPWPDSRAAELPFMQPLNKDGVAVLTGIPIEKRYEFTLEHESLKLDAKGAAANRSNQISFQLPSTDPVTLKVTTIPATE